MYTLFACDPANPANNSITRPRLTLVRALIEGRRYTARLGYAVFIYREWNASHALDKVIPAPLPR